MVGVWGKNTAGIWRIRELRIGCITMDFAGGCLQTRDMDPGTSVWLSLESS